MTDLNPKTIAFLKEMYEFLEDDEKEMLKDSSQNLNFLELLILKYGRFELKYSHRESLVMAAIIIRRGFWKKSPGKVIWYTTDEYLDLFWFLFDTKGDRLWYLKTECLIRVENFIKKNVKM